MGERAQIRVSEITDEGIQSKDTDKTFPALFPFPTVPKESVVSLSYTDVCLRESSAFGLDNCMVQIAYRGVQ
jgi:hypothetical protein